MISGDRFDEFARSITLRTESLVPLVLRSPQLCNKKSPKFDLSIHRNRDVLNFSPILVASNRLFQSGSLNARGIEFSFLFR